MDQPDNAKSGPRIVERQAHTISRRDIDPDALKVLYRLARNRLTGYLVGGGVRDLLLGREPKDFDIGTHATPPELRRLFKNSRTIGRRFPIVHVYFRGGKVVEVSTFRRNAPDSGDGRRIVRDDSWGSPEEDAWRRDLTINGLFYDIETFSVIDYVGGLDDLERRIIRTIGDPFVRFREDPVRIIRAVRHAARIGFEIEPRTWEAMTELHPLIATCSAPRVLEEFLRELRGGCAAPSIKLMSESGLLADLAPRLDAYVRAIGTDGEEGRQFWARLEALDATDLNEVPAPNAVALSVVIGAVVGPEVTAAEKSANGNRRPDIGKVVRDALVPVLTDLGISRRDLERCFHIYLAGRRLFRIVADGGHIPGKLQAKSYFPDSWAYVRILLEAEGWSEERIEALRRSPSEKRRRRRPRSRSRSRSRQRARTRTNAGDPHARQP